MKITVHIILQLAVFCYANTSFTQSKVKTAGVDITTVSSLRMPGLFGNGMVLQRNQKMPVWGWAKAGTSVSVRFKKQYKKTRVDKDGKWFVKLDEEPEGGPFTLTIVATDTIHLQDVLIGDVWVCSGQSNMEFPVSLVLDAAKEIAEANYPLIRQFNVPKTVSLQPADTMKGGEWKICSPATVKNFTAVGYFFARSLYNELKVPIGLINTNIGGTHIETWISKSAFEHEETFNGMINDLPTVSVEEIGRWRMKVLTKRIDSLQGSLPVSAETGRWTAPTLDDGSWPVMLLPALWENRGWPQLDGKVWFRKEVFINASDTGGTAFLELGNIDDSDESYINGIKAGATKNNPAGERKYVLPPGLLKAGKNVVVIGVEDTGGGGGFGGNAEKFKISAGSTTIPLTGNWHYKIETVYPSGLAIYPNTYPTLLYNAMINPLIPYAIKGVTWYQGESNASRAFEYRKTFPLLINDWRSQWQQGNFPFLYVQLASFNAATENIQRGSTWAELREAQTMALSLPNTGMAVTTDIGDANDIHPKNKQDVGKRLAAVAFNKVYGRQVVCSGPVYTTMKTEGNKAVILFDNAAAGFLVKDRNGYIKGFTIAGADKHFYYAKAFVQGNAIVVYHDEVNNPVAVRYAWADNAGDANLFNKEGFPAVPFRTDTWPGITVNEKYLAGK